MKNKLKRHILNSPSEQSRANTERFPAALLPYAGLNFLRGHQYHRAAISLKGFSAKGYFCKQIWQPCMLLQILKNYELKRREWKFPVGFFCLTMYRFCPDLWRGKARNICSDAVLQRRGTLVLCYINILHYVFALLPSSSCQEASFPKDQKQEKNFEGLNPYALLTGHHQRPFLQ